MFVADLIMSVQSHLLEQYFHDMKVFKHHVSDVLCTEKSSCKKIVDRYYQVIATISYISDCDMRAVRNHCIYLE